MRILSDSIEEFIKTLMTDDEEHSEIEVRRNELAQHFGCAPSQINYVLATRFTPDHGYVIESRRGGGGYIRIVRITSSGRQEYLQSLYQRIGARLSVQEAAHMIENLKTEKVITEDEGSLMLAAVAPFAVALPLDTKEMICAGTMRSMLLSIAKRRENA